MGQEYLCIIQKKKNGGSPNKDEIEEQPLLKTLCKLNILEKIQLLISYLFLLHTFTYFFGLILVKKL